MASDSLRTAIGAVLFSVSNFPEKVQSRLLGQDMGPLNAKLVDAVLASDWLAEYRRQITEDALNWAAQRLSLPEYARPYFIKDARKHVALAEKGAETNGWSADRCAACGNAEANHPMVGHPFATAEKGADR